MMALTKERSVTKTDDKSITDEIAKVGFNFLLIFSVLVGIVSLSALVAGAIKVGGVGTLIGMAFGVI